MNLKCRLILEDYRKQRDDFIKLGDVVHTMLSDITKELGLTVLAVEHRVKQEKSLAGKLERKGDGYNTLEDITDILGCRVIWKMLLDICPFITFARFLLAINGRIKYAAKSLKFK